jgi:hypothetical protein
VCIRLVDDFSIQFFEETAILGNFSQDVGGMPNGLCYPLVGGTGQCRFAGTSFKPRKLPENAASPTSRVHAVLGAGLSIINTF